MRLSFFGFLLASVDLELIILEDWLLEDGYEQAFKEITKDGSFFTVLLLGLLLPEVRERKSTLKNS